MNAPTARAPRPLPLFLDLVRRVAERDPDLARDALAGLRAYAEAPTAEPAPTRPEVARVCGATLRDHGGDGPPVVLVPSLINPPRILDLDAEVSLAGAITRMGRRVLLLDWGAAAERARLGIGGHVEALLLPLLGEIGEPAALVGYCLGGTMAIAAANLAPCERVVTLAAPWHFERYPERSRTALTDIWRSSKAAAQSLGALPMEVLQGAFWSLDPQRTVAKFAEFGGSIPTVPRRADLSRSRSGRTPASPCPTPLPSISSRECSAGTWQGAASGKSVAGQCERRCRFPRPTCSPATTSSLRRRPRPRATAGP